MRIISGSLKGRVLKTVEGPGYRPAMSRVREALFSMLQSRIMASAEENTDVNAVTWNYALDLFAGSGSLAFECLSRGSKQALLVEHSAQAVRCLRQNAQSLGLSDDVCRIVQEDVLKFLSKPSKQKFDLVFIDPPYGKDLLTPTLNALLRQGWVHENSIIMAEIEAKILYDGENAHQHLQMLTQRTFGQTRIILWQIKNI